jgi:hypothetical protein
MSIKDVLGTFSSDEFSAPKPIPHGQWNNVSKSNYGLLIDRKNLEASRFNHVLAIKNGWRKISQEFGGSPTPVDCLVTPNPIIIVLRRGNTKLYDRTSGDFLGNYNRREHAGLVNINKISRFLVFLAVHGTEGYQFLHPDPLQLPFKGVQRGAFLEPGGHLDTLDKAANQFYSGAPKFAFAIHITTTSQQRGKAGSTSQVTCLTKPDPITTQENLDKFFVGEQNLQLLMSAYEQTKNWQVLDSGSVVDEESSVEE